MGYFTILIWACIVTAGCKPSKINEYAFLSSQPFLLTLLKMSTEKTGSYNRP
jgi:hypothetical protein